MKYVYLAVFIAGLLLGVRIMFFGAERRRRPTPDTLPLRRWEPAVVGFLVVAGIASYLLRGQQELSLALRVVIASALGLVAAAATTGVAVATARIRPAHDEEDPRFLLQGRVGVVTTDIPAGGEGVIRYDEAGGSRSARARGLEGSAIGAGVEVCIERVEDGVAHVERWTLVEQRL